jgi:hypothetical protein
LHRSGALGLSEGDPPAVPGDERCGVRRDDGVLAEARVVHAHLALAAADEQPEPRGSAPVGELEPHDDAWSRQRVEIDEVSEPPQEDAGEPGGPSRYELPYVQVLVRS